MKKYICNPLNLDYRYQIKKIVSGDTVFREAADPTMLLFKEVYYLFASVSGGFWYSDDMLEWRFRETPELPAYDYAPDVREINGKVIFSASSGDPCTIYASADPLNEPFSPVSTPFPFWDPAIFQDDDGRVYLYWGCSNDKPLWGIEMNPETMTAIGEKSALLAEREDIHGWERNGENNRLSAPKNPMERKVRETMGRKPFLEAPFMNKHGGKYYLQYAAPGAEYNVYGDGVYVGSAPLGPFEFQAHNPFSSKPGGFLPGAGHGNTFQDKSGNWWHASSMRISVNETFERRIGLFPCDFDSDGIMHCNQNFADYPFCLPGGKRADMNRTAPDWNLLSYRKHVSASSRQHGFEAEKGVDEDIRTWWAADKSDSGAWYQIDMGSVCEVYSAQVNFADHYHAVPEHYKNWLENTETSHVYNRLIIKKAQKTGFLLEGSADGESWRVLKDSRSSPDDFAHDFICFDAPLKLRYVRVSHMNIPFGGVPAISGLRIFGKGAGTAPAAVTEIDAVRSNDGLDAYLKWNAVTGADGYNIRYGIAPDKIYNSWQIFENELTLSLLNHGTGYYIAADSFNENGVTAGTVIYIK
jgi:hypothetical protein